MNTPQKQQSIALVVALIEDLLPGASIVSGRDVPPDIGQVAVLRFEHPFVVRHGPGPEEAIAVLVKDDLLEDEDGREHLVRRLRDADLSRFVEWYPRGTIAIGKERISILDTGE